MIIAKPSAFVKQFIVHWREESLLFRQQIKRVLDFETHEKLCKNQNVLVQKSISFPAS